MLAWSEKSAKGLAALYKHYNDVEIFVEDTDLKAEKIYRNIFSRVFNGKRIQRVVGLGSKANVISAATTSKAEDKGKVYYIVDGDLDLITDNNPKSTNLYVLSRYCIENYLLCENAILEFLDNILNLSKEEIALKLDFNGWLNSNHQLVRLFIAFAVFRDIGGTSTTVKTNLSRFISDDSGTIDSAKISTEIGLLRGQVDPARFDEKMHELELRLFNPASFKKVLVFVSAKHFLIRLLKMRVRHVGFQVNNNYNILYFVLSKNCNIEELKTDLE